MATDASSKKLLLQWFLTEYTLKGEGRNLVRKLMSSSIIERLHFVRNTDNKKYSVDIYIGDSDYFSEVEEYEQSFEVYISGRRVSLREFFDVITMDRKSHIYINLEYDNSFYCERLNSVIEPIIPIESLFAEVKREFEERKEKFNKIDQAIDEALDNKDKNKFMYLSERKQTLLKDEPLM